MLWRTLILLVLLSLPISFNSHSQRSTGSGNVRTMIELMLNGRSEPAPVAVAPWHTTHIDMRTRESLTILFDPCDHDYDSD